MIRFFQVTLLLSISLFFVQCEDDCECTTPKEGFVHIEYHIMNNGVEISLNETFEFATMNEMMLEKFKFYLSNVYAVQENNASYYISDVTLIDFENAEMITGQYSIPVGNYKKISFGLGLDSVQNDSDPTSFDLDHPLGSGQGMFWSWAQKYRFIIVEGRANENDTLGQVGDVIMAYHPGADEFYDEYSDAVDFEIKENQTVFIDAYIELEDIFDGPGGVIDIPTENTSHTTPDDYYIAEKFMKNFAKAIDFRSI